MQQLVAPKLKISVKQSSGDLPAVHSCVQLDMTFLRASSFTASLHNQVLAVTLACAGDTLQLVCCPTRTILEVRRTCGTRTAIPAASS